MRTLMTPAVMRIWIVSIVDVQEGEARVAIQADGSRTDLDLGARTLLRPEIVAGGQRAIEHGRRPVLLASRLYRNIALDEAESRGAIRRIRIVRLALLCPGQPEHQTERQGREGSKV